MGNEPFEYPNDLYRSILHGMAMGVKAADRTVKVLPATLKFANAADVLSTDKSNVSQYLDGLNTHIYR